MDSPFVYKPIPSGARISHSIDFHLLVNVGGEPKLKPFKESPAAPEPDEGDSEETMPPPAKKRSKTSKERPEPPQPPAAARAESGGGMMDISDLLDPPPLA